MTKNKIFNLTTLFKYMRPDARYLLHKHERPPSELEATNAFQSISFDEASYFAAVRALKNLKPHKASTYHLYIYELDGQQILTLLEVKNNIQDPIRSA